MATHILGISAFYHDSAAALVSDGNIVAAAQEERFTRVKHDPLFPRHAINYCLEEAFIEPDELDAVVFYDNPVLSFDRVIQSLVQVAPKGEEQWVRAAPAFLGVKPFPGSDKSLTNRATCHSATELDFLKPSFNHLSTVVRGGDAQVRMPARVCEPASTGDV